MADAVRPLPVSHWLARLDGDGHLPFKSVYGGDPAVWAERRALLRRTLTRFRDAFGDHPVRLFRAPGRINLRGMHVDTHGGYLNLMTHQREVVAVAADLEGGPCRFVNTSPGHPDITIDMTAWRDHPHLGEDWAALIASPEAAERRRNWQGGWGGYVEGALLRAMHDSPEDNLSGMFVAIGSDLPSGAALSSSAALCVAVLLAARAQDQETLPCETLVTAARDAEWFTGSRCGLSDQAAIVLGRPGQYVHLAIHGNDPGLDNARWGTLADNLAILVADSRTVRSISGRQKIAYTRNRFAYSMALEVVRQEMARMDMPEAFIRQADRLSRITPERAGGEAKLFELLARVPDAISLAELRERYAIPDLDAVYARYFGDLPREQLNGPISLRGPLFFGLAESERARLWPLALQDGDRALAGRLMSIGHNGDRVVDGNSVPFDRHIDAPDLAALAATAVPIALCPGDYGASTPVLDGLVDAAMASGALGASLTGAGLAGCVVALCEASSADAVAKGMRRWLASPAYADRAGRTLGEEEVEAAVVRNHATAGAGELRF